MRIAFTVVLALLAAGCTDMATRESSASLVTPTGRSQRINFFTTLNGDCTSRGETEVRILKQPANGRLVVAPALDYPTYASTSGYSHCNQRRVPGTKVTYVPNPGFVGQDTMVIEGFYPTGRALRASHTVTVR